MLLQMQAKQSKCGTDPLIAVVIKLLIVTPVEIQFMLFQILRANVTHLFRFMFRRRKKIRTKWYRNCYCYFYCLLHAYCVPITVHHSYLWSIQLNIYSAHTHTQTHMPSSRFEEIKHIDRKRHSIQVNCKLLTAKLQIKIPVLGIRTNVIDDNCYYIDCVMVSN